MAYNNGHPFLYFNKPETYYLKAGLDLPTFRTKECNTNF